MDQCDEGLAVQVVCPGRCLGVVQLLHEQGEDEERRQKRVRNIFYILAQIIFIVMLSGV